MPNNSNEWLIDHQLASSVRGYLGNVHEEITGDAYCEWTYNPMPAMVWTCICGVWVSVHETLIYLDGCRN